MAEANANLSFTDRKLEALLANARRMLRMLTNDLETRSPKFNLEWSDGRYLATSGIEAGVRAFSVHGVVDHPLMVSATAMALGNAPDGAQFCCQHLISLGVPADDNIRSKRSKATLRLNTGYVYRVEVCSSALLTNSYVIALEALRKGRIVVPPGRILSPGCQDYDEIRIARRDSAIVSLSAVRPEPGRYPSREAQAFGS